MEKLVFDDGIRSYRLNGGGVLRFNPGDPNVYARFLSGEQRLRELEAEFARKGAGEGGEAVALLAELDRQMKLVLNEIFGPENDFQVLLKGVNLLAVAGNGERVVTNLFAALEPVLTEGAQRCARQKTAEAVEKARQRRAQL